MAGGLGRAVATIQEKLSFPAALLRPSFPVELSI